MPFAPGAIYGDDEPVPKWSIGSPQLRRQGIRQLLCREDRLAAPMMALRYTDGKWMAVFHHASGADTTVADRGKVAGGEALIDRRFDFASLGGVERHGRASLGAFFPGSEGPSLTAPARPPFVNTVIGAGAFIRWPRASGTTTNSHLPGARRPRRRSSFPPRGGGRGTNWPPLPLRWRRDRWLCRAPQFWLTRWS